MIKKIFNTSLLILLFASSVSFSQESDNIKDVTILHWNDFHARNLPYRVTKKNNDTGTDSTYYVGGTASMLGYLNKYRTANSLILNGGDDFQGTPISSLTRGKSQIELLNLYSLDAFVVGNHEFDYGELHLDSVLKEANFDVLSANVFLKTPNRTIGKPWVTKTINGVKFGIIGLTALDLMTLTVPKNVTDVQMLNTDSLINEGIKFCKDEKCNVIVLLTHIGLDNDKKLADKFYKDVDIIVGAHSHTALFKPTIKNNVFIVQAGSYARYLGKLDLKVDVSKDTVLSGYGKLIETVLDSTSFDIPAAKKVENMVASIQGDLLKVIGKLNKDWFSSYKMESNLGQWQADAMRKRFNTDLAVLNAGGIRKSLPKGEITVNDMWEINPFGNTVVIIKLTGKAVKQMFKNNLQTYVKEMDELGSSDLSIVSGLKVEYDGKKVLAGDDNFIVSIKTADGKDIDDNKIYTISTNNYLGGQFKKYYGDVGEEIILNDTNVIDRDVMIDAVIEQKVIEGTVENRLIDISKNK
ncbi:MAG: 5'-nucleotidase C-terminal domain-containing protein [Bacteroidetes bacterium]|nr:5'-nucleotidase C-terminal domain-containing protein [Bacteroidota bacterium]